VSIARIPLRLLLPLAPALLGCRVYSAGLATDATAGDFVGVGLVEPSQRLAPIGQVAKLPADMIGRRRAKLQQIGVVLFLLRQRRKKLRK